MKKMLSATICAAVSFASPAFAEPAMDEGSQWKGQVSGEYIRSEDPFHVIATDDEAWTKAWRLKLDEEPPRALADGEVGVILIGGPRPSPGYSVQLTVAETPDALTLKAWVESPEVTMFPSGSSNHPWRAAILGNGASGVEVNWGQ